MADAADAVEPPPDVVELGDGTVEVRLDARMTSVRRARVLVQQRWSGLDDQTLADVELIATELVANAVLHGRPDIVFRLRADPFAVDLEVLDHGEELPTMPAGVGSAAVPGRGLALIDSLADRWGVERLHGEAGKVVWASVQR